MHMRWDPLSIEGSVVPPTIKNHTATPISRHELLVFGGYDGRRNHNELYLFNSIESRWSLFTPIYGQPPAGRNGHTATLVKNRLFIIGGWLGRGPLASNDMHVLDIETHTWNEPPVLGTPPGPCNMHTADYIPHLNSIIVFRGGDGREYLNDIHALHVETMIWQKIYTTGTPPVPRANHSSTLVNQDQIVIFGGWDGYQRLNDVHILDTRHMVWSAVHIHQPSIPNHFIESNRLLPHPRAGMTFVRHRDHIFLFGGSGPSSQCYNDLHLYNPYRHEWLPLKTISENHVHELLQDDEEDYGDSDDISTPSSLSSDYIEDPLLTANPNDIHIHNHYQPIIISGRGPGRRAGHTCTVLEERKLFIFGGSYGNEYLNDMFVLDTDPPPRAMITTCTSPVLLLQKALSKYVNSPQLSDISFLVEGHVIYAHKLILSVLSERFRSMFSGHFHESQQTQIVLPDIRYIVFLKMLTYLYTGTFEEGMIQSISNGNERQELIENNLESYEDGMISETDMEILLELLIAADQFMLDHLKQLCERALQYSITIDTVADVLAAANQSNALQLKAICMHFIRNHNMKIVEQDEDEQSVNCPDTDECHTSMVL